MPSKMPTEGTEMLCLHPPKRLFRLRLRRCGGNTGQQHLQRGPTGTNGDQQPSNPSNPQQLRYPHLRAVAQSHAALNQPLVVIGLGADRRHRASPGGQRTGHRPPGKEEVGNR